MSTRRPAGTIEPAALATRGEPGRPSSAAPNTGQANVRLALRKPEAAEALGVSDETFDRYVRPTLPVVRLGSTRVYPVEALTRWLLENASTPADELEVRR